MHKMQTRQKSNSLIDNDHTGERGECERVNFNPNDGVAVSACMGLVNIFPLSFIEKF